MLTVINSLTPKATTQTYGLKLQLAIADSTSQAFTEYQLSKHDQSLSQLPKIYFEIKKFKCLKNPEFWLKQATAKPTPKSDI